MTVDLSLEMSVWERELTRRGPSVVAIGGGYGLAGTLRAVRPYAGDVTAVVSVADDGGSSGRLRQGMDIPPPGDIRKCLLALAPDRSVWSDLFEYRYPGGDPDPMSTAGVDVLGHSLGNLLLAALADLEGGFSEGVFMAGRLLGIEGLVVPAADTPLVLEAVIGDDAVSGQVAVSRAPGRISRFSIGPAHVRATPAALEAIGKADQIVLSAGSLFTSVIAALAVPGIADAINSARAPLVAVLNLITQDAETLGMTGDEHVEALSTYGGLRRDGTLVVDASPITPPPGHDKLEVGLPPGWAVVRALVAAMEAPWPEHDSTLLGQVLATLA